VSQPWALAVGDQRAAEGRAMFLQFQQQLADLGAAVQDLSLVKATDYFRYLPPVGLLPLALSGKEPTPGGFNLKTFFGSHWPQTVTFLEDDLRSVLDDGYDHEALDLNETFTVNVYLIPENWAAWLDGKQKQLVVVFTGPRVRYRGDARFGEATWTGSRFATPTQ
jgi:hypothetical protein